MEVVLIFVSIYTIFLISQVVMNPIKYDTTEESVPRAPKIAGKRVLYIPTHLAQELHSLECEIQGTPTPRVVWTKDGKEVHDPYTTKFNASEGKAQLEFPKHKVFEKSYEGNYSCVAINFLGYETKFFVIST